MSKQSNDIDALSQSKLGDRIRSIANQLRQEDQIQSHAIARILGASAQIAQNHDHLINEVVEMVEEDLEQSVLPTEEIGPYTVEQLKQEFVSFKAAKDYFNIKARSWNQLIDLINDKKLRIEKNISSSEVPSVNTPSNLNHHLSSENLLKNSQDQLHQHLHNIEQNIQHLRKDTAQILLLLTKIAER